MGQRQSFNKWCWENWTATCERMKLEHLLTPYTKVNSKCIKDLNVRPETVKLLEEDIGRTRDDISQSKILCNPPPRVMEIKTKVSKWDLIKLKSFYTAKKNTSSVQFSCSVMSDSLQPHESQHARPLCPSPTPGVHLDSRPSSP